MPPQQGEDVVDSAITVYSTDTFENSFSEAEQEKSPQSNRFNIGKKLYNILDKFQRFMCVLFVNQPGRVFCIGTLVIFGVAVVAVRKMEVSDATDYDWIVTDSVECDHVDITNDILSRVDPVGGSSEDAVPPLSELGPGMQITYQSTDLENGNLFSPESIQAICQVESDIWNLEEFEKDFCTRTSNQTMQMPGSTNNCSTPNLSLTARFYKWPPYGDATSRECVLLSNDQVQQVKYSLFAQLKEDGAPTAFFFDSVSPDEVKRVRSLLSFGGPLEGFDNKNDRNTEQMTKYRDFTAIVEKKLWERFGLENTFFRSAYRNKADFGPIRAEFFSFPLSDLEFSRLVNSDLMWTILAIAFVYGYITFHTGSFFLALVGILQILLSLPISFFFYFYVFQITFYSQLHILAIFLVLGVGADNVFVLVDSWKLYQNYPEYNEVTFTNLLPGYKRAFGAIFNTSLTTAMAFISTSVSPIMPISTFGIYAAMAIVVNYLYVVFFLPSAVMLQYYYFSKSCAFWRSERPLYTTITWEEAQKVNLHELSMRKEHRLHTATQEESTTKVGFLQRFFQGPYTRFITSRPGAIATVLVFTAVMIQGIYFGLQLETPKESEKWFSDDHMWTGLLDSLSRDFLAGPDNSYVDGSLIWGVDGIDRSMFDPYKPGDNRGTAIFTDEFDISTPEAHEVLLGACKALREKKCGENEEVAEGCMDNSGMLVRFNSVKCWIEDMENYNNGTLPTGDEFLPALVEFRENLTNEQKVHVNSIGFVDGVLRYVRVPFVYTLEKRQPMEATNSAKDLVMDVVKDINDKSPATLGDCFAEGEIWFAWVKTEFWLVRGMFLGFAICFPVAFLVLLVATGGNLRIAAFATISIVGIVSTVLGLCQSVFGWDLGVAESIAAVIVIGFSVDYVCHLSHPYAHAASPYRKERTAESAKTMATTVAAGGMTTLGAGLCMFGCQMTFFSKMAILISLTISLSLGYSLGFFMGLCALFGPQGKIKEESMPLKDGE